MEFNLESGVDRVEPPKLCYESEAYFLIFLDFYIFELGKPKIKKQLKDIELEEGKTLTLETEIYSEPEATVKWFKNGQECKADARLKINHDSKRYEEYSMTLNLCKPQEDTGTYEVRAKNLVGETISKCQVNILSEFAKK